MKQSMISRDMKRTTVIKSLISAITYADKVRCFSLREPIFDLV
jgi:uncharacterized protein YqeY